MVTHRNLASNALALVDLGLHARDVLLHALPIFHIHGLFVANHCALLSGAQMLCSKIRCEKLVLRSRATVMMGVPTFYTRLLTDRIRSRKTCATCACSFRAPRPCCETFVRFDQRSGQAILERYGMTESGMNTSNPLQGERRGGSVGFPLPGVESV